MPHNSKRLLKLIKALKAAEDPQIGRVPIERLVSQNIQSFTELRDNGLTWISITQALAWRRANGHPISSDQLRSAFSRANRGLRSPAAGLPRGLDDNQPNKAEVPIRNSAGGSLEQAAPVQKSTPNDIRERLNQLYTVRNFEENDG